MTKQDAEYISTWRGKAVDELILSELTEATRLLTIKQKSFYNKLQKRMEE